MYAPRDVERRLCLELGPPRLRVRFDHFRERWCCYEATRRLGGARRVPFALSGQGELLPGETRFRTVHDYDDLVVVLEAPGGGYQSLDPNLLVEELVRRDSFRHRHRDIAAHLLRRAREARERRGREQSDLFADLAAENRRRFARVADDMGA